MISHKSLGLEVCPQKYRRKSRGSKTLRRGDGTGGCREKRLKEKVGNYYTERGGRGANAKEKNGGGKRI